MAGFAPMTVLTTNLQVTDSLLMNMMTMLGTRPEVIRLSLIIHLLDRFCDKQWLVHTGQKFEEKLSSIFLCQLGIREPDLYMTVQSSSFAQQAAQILEKAEALFLQHRPERLLILGGAESGLAAIVARRLGIPVYHLDAGARCFDARVGEELNRRLIDQASTVWMPYSRLGRDNLLAEGYPAHQIHVTGNPLKQVIDRFGKEIGASNALDHNQLTQGHYFLAVLSRAETVEREDRLRQLISVFGQLHRQYGYPIAVAVHPRTRSSMKRFGIELEQMGVVFMEPMSFFDFTCLEKNAFCLLSDSGTVEEEACLFGVPGVALRECTERAETVECGANLLAGVQPAALIPAVALAVEQRGAWRAPAEYLSPFVAETVCKIILGYRPPEPAETAWRASAQVFEPPALIPPEAPLVAHQTYHPPLTAKKLGN